MAETKKNGLREIECRFDTLVIGLLASIFFVLRIPAVFADEPELIIEKTALGDNQPVIVNGDKVEYATDQKAVVASGNVSVEYKGTKLTCNEISVDTATKNAVASGQVRIQDAHGLMTGERIKYNFEEKTGTVVDGEFMVPPLFGSAESIERVSETEYRGIRSSVTTCNADDPHFKMKSKKILVYPDERIKAYGNVLYIGKVPFLYLPYVSHSLKDPFMHVQLSPGYSKRWGPYLLSAWRYNVMPGVDGRIYADYRQRRGFGDGFGMTVVTEDYGRSDFKYYYTQERPRDTEQDKAGEFERYFGRWRHNWIIDKNSTFIAEFNKIDDAKQASMGSDHNILKDYFYQEYEKDAQPRSYAQWHRNFAYSSMDVLVEGRVNDWYNPGYVESLPQVSYVMPSYQFGDSQFYFDSSSTVASLTKKNETATSATPDVHYNRLDTTNKVSMPFRCAFLNFNPYTGTRETVYDKDLHADARARTIFLTGTDVSTKFYRLFDVQTNALGLDIKGLRHVITPSVGYAYDHEPTIPADDLRQIDSADAITYSNNRANLELVNTLQTKRGGKTVDVVTGKVGSVYYFKPKSVNGSYLSDISYDLDMRPYSWMRLNSDGIYSHRNDYFSEVNYDLYFDVGKEKTIGVGQRYLRSSGNELTFSTDWRLTPKWKFGVYERFQMKESSFRNGFIQQEYRLSRDLHCWIVDFTYTDERDQDHAIWIVFRLKAFPETRFSFDHSYHARRTGAQ